ncbi:DNA-directed RNA polymerase I subunit RPA49 [Sugiyamaella lignohabitans]|uniref:DNA-directed RNA polymerase I subunit RPA49 n=1 Tax=Sugiyamaella lignohabitans TaxID=796027 RepID=A0A167CST9_9ASCO|nr:DNA-directed RNA polymerase I subunit RPA49 [Sugiyamaella lignohabitans]ANB12065.1 DNA-directed RNA polymerase I subunit RPA49 [Sugiyamaella lignohabitans]
MASTKATEVVKLQTKLLIDDERESSAILGQFPGINVSETASFELYKSKSGKALVHGQSDKLEYDGVSEGKDGNKYCVAVYDPQTKSLQLVPTPLVALSTIVKSKKRVRGPDIKQSNVRNSIQRTALGEAFGTKKAKKAITDLERNKIDADLLQDLETAIVDTVKTSTENLPSHEKIQEALSSERPIPPYNLEATDTSLIYPLIDGVFSKQEYDAMKVASIILKEKDDAKRIAMFPQKTSTYIHTRVQNTILSEISSVDKIHKIKLLYYASLLIAVYENRRISSKTALLAKLGNPPEILVQGVINKFTVSKAGRFGRSKDMSFAIDPACENKLLCYFLVLALHLDNFSVEIPPLVHELSLKPSKLADLFKALGCNIKVVGASKSNNNAGLKIAVLKAPLRLPEVAKRKRAGGR